MEDRRSTSYSGDEMSAKEAAVAMKLDGKNAQQITSSTDSVKARRTKKGGKALESAVAATLGKESPESSKAVEDGSGCEVK